MIDLHSHVLPGIDDGPADLGRSLRMLEVAQRSGTRVIAATPHVRADHPGVIPLEVPQRVIDLNEAASRAGLTIRVVPGGEVALLEALERDLDELRAVTLGANGVDLLVETPWGALTSGFESLLGRVRARGFRVVLAHPELNRTFQNEHDRLRRLARDGVLLQITASSLASSPRSDRGRLALLGLREGWVHLLASDGHAADWRPPSLLEGLAAGGERIPEARSRLAWMVETAPRAVLEGQALPAIPPDDLVRRRRWSLRNR